MILHWAYLLLSTNFFLNRLIPFNKMVEIHMHTVRLIIHLSIHSLVPITVFWLKIRIFDIHLSTTNNIPFIDYVSSLLFFSSFSRSLSPSLVNWTSFRVMIFIQLTSYKLQFKSTTNPTPKKLKLKFFTLFSTTSIYKKNNDQKLILILHHMY